MPAGQGGAGGQPSRGVVERLSRRWAQVGPSPFPWEQAGLDHVQGLMPDVDPYRAVALFTFTAFSGRISECDLFIAVPGGLYLVELKGHPGRLTNRGSEWTFQPIGTDNRTRNLHLRNPLHAVDMKSKDLKNRLQRAAQRRNLNLVIPRIEPAVFLSDEGLQSELDEVERLRVYGRNDRPTGLPRIWDDLLGRPPARESERVLAALTSKLPMLFNDIGVNAPQAHLTYADEWKLAGKPLDQGPTWEDRLARRHGLVDETGRVRIYLAEMGSEQANTAVWRAAEREYHVLQGLRHRGIAEARDIKQHGGVPAILFRHDESDLRLDQYMSAFGDRMSFETRLNLVRQLAEALRYAHRRSLYHRTLAARSVYVSARPDGSKPVLRVVDWQTAARDFSDTSSTRLRSLGRDSVTEAHLQNSTALYLAPEFNAEYPDPAGLDVFGLGAVSYLVLTGEPPAPTRGGLQERLEAERGLHPAALLDGLGDELDRLIFSATRFEVDDRLPDVDVFLEELGRVERGESHSGLPTEAPAGYADPLEARPGDWISAELCVREILGTGGTGHVLLVEQMRETESGEVEVSQHVVKVALNQTDATERILAEAEALRKIGGGQIVRLVDGPNELGGHQVLNIQFAGDRSLARVLREEGRLPYIRLKNFATNLFQALLVLEREEVLHRDIKPDNLGVFRIPRNDERELLLFDFSLAAARETDVTSGTSGYLDPFLGTPSRTRYDEHAERYAVAVTLHQMASGEKPVWGTGGSDPRSLTDEVPSISAELFNQSLREGLTEFFERALNRDVERRFDSARDMVNAWNRVFNDAERTTPAVTGSLERLSGSVSELAAQRDSAAEAAGLHTALDAAGLSPVALEVAHSLEATTVGELMAVAQWRINRARGAGTLAKRELNQRYKEWAKRFKRAAAAAAEQDQGAATTPDSSATPTVLPESLPVDAMAAALITAVEATVKRKSGKVAAICAYLGLPDPSTSTDSQPLLPFWPTRSDTTRALGITQSASVNQYVNGAVAEWSGLEWLERVRDDLSDILLTTGRVMSVRELASELRARAGAQTDDRALALRYALAVTRAALHVEDGGDEPRFTESRRSAGVFVACESLPGSAVLHPSQAELVDYAVQLGVCADDAVKAEPLPSAKAVRSLLRAVPEPEGLTPLTDSRLVTLAATASKGALASPRFDLYPRDLDLERALRISQAAAGVGHQPGVTVTDLVERIKVRFPELDFGDVTHIQLDPALERAGYPLKFDYGKQVYRGPERSLLQSTGLSSLTRTGGSAGTAGPAEIEAAVKRLGESMDTGGFRALTVHVRHLPGLASAIASRYPVILVDGNAELLECFRELATEKNQDWARVLRVDAKLTVSGSAPVDSPRAYAGYVAELANRLAERWAQRASAPKSVLFLHNAGLLARYWDIAGRELLTGLQQSARRPREAPYGLWLLCPAEDARRSPQLDGRTVETVVPDGEWIVLGSAAAEELRNGGREERNGVEAVEVDRHEERSTG